MGPRKEFNPVGDEERNARPESKRPRLFNLRVSLSTKKLRAKIANASQEINANVVSKVASVSSSSSQQSIGPTTASEPETGRGHRLV